MSDKEAKLIDTIEQDIRDSALRWGFDPHGKQADMAVEGWKAGTLTFDRDNQGRIDRWFLTPEFMRFVERKKAGA
jgi:hypothetical protein